MLRRSSSDATMVGVDTIRALHEVLDQQAVGVVFQPIVDARTRMVYAYEALARSLSPHFRGPIELFEAAVQAGRVGELGRLHRSQAVSQCRGWPLFLNVYPTEFDYGWLVRPDDPMFRHDRPVCLEITESVPLEYFEQCHSVLAEVRKKGVSLAIDDLGAGYSNLKYISDLAPNVVKLDRQLVANLSLGTRQFRLLRSVVALCKEMNAKVVAEGVETSEELASVLAAEVDFIQGYLLARPEATPAKPRWPRDLD
jgi:EAL domain-containing protein (putative c-di-GMP-specific phosphodiesterase class I)